MIYTTVTGAYQVGTALHTSLAFTLGMLVICLLILLDMRRRKESL